MEHEEAKNSTFIDPHPLEALHGLAGELMYARRQRIIQAEGRPVEGMFLLDDGWIAGSILLSGGARQIVSLYLPGDLIGTESLFRAEATETLTPLVEASYRVVSLEQALQLVSTDAAVLSGLLRDSLTNMLTAKKQMASIGRTPAIARMAGLLVDLAFRLGHKPDSGPCEFECFLNQEQIGDYAGLTSVHVNRTLKRLAQAGLISRRKAVVRIPDLPALARESEVTPPWERLNEEKGVRRVITS